MKFSFLLVAVVLGNLAVAAPVLAQEAPAIATPAPSDANQTPIDRDYDGHTHVMVAPYIWAPTVRANFQYSIPTLKPGPGRALLANVQVGPSQYVPKLDSAAMFAFDARRGDLDLFGDIVYLNASTSGTFSSTISGPLGKVQIPVTVNSTARLSVAFWEAALGFSVARGHNADLSLIAGMRQLPINVAVGYSAVVGQRGIIAPSGSVSPSEVTKDVMVGIRGRAFVDRHLYVPYYADYGTGVSGIANTSWQAYAGAGYAFNHGQSVVLLWRQLDYDNLPATAHLQGLDLGGPLFGYTLNL